MKYQALFGFVLCVFTVMAVEPSTNAHWITNEDPEIIDDYQTNRWQNTSLSMNRDCGHVFEQQLGSSNQCRITTNFGEFYDDELARPGTSELGPITDITGRALPIPHSDNLFSTRSMVALGGSYLYFYENAENNLESNFLWGTLRHSINQDSRQLLERANGMHGLISRYSISFSANGRYMLGKTGNSLVRIDTTDGSEFYFGNGRVGGQSRGLKTAISSDGEYAFVSNHVGQFMRLYRLSDCELVDEQTMHNDCPYKLISDSLREAGYTPIFGTRQARFLRNSTLYLYFSTGTWPPHTEAHSVLMIAPGSSEAEFDYLALGDSFASGEGAYNYRPETDSSQNTCRVSRDSYSYLLRDIVGLDSFASVACSGAVIDDVFFSDRREYAGQVDDIFFEDRTEGEINQYLKAFYPGHLNQSDFVEEYAPEYITVSAIGNDIGFDDIIKRCVSFGTCYSSFEDRQELSQEIKSHIPRLTTALEGLQKRGHHEATIYAIGYPQIVKEGGDCGLNVRLNADEVAFANRLIDYINAVIDISARRSGAVYVDVSTAFSGFKLCEATDFPAMHGLTAGYDVPDWLSGPIGKESYHPTAHGHDLLANEIRKQTNGFAVTAEPIDDMAWFADPMVVTDFLGTSPEGQTSRPLYITHYENNLSPDYGVYGESIPVFTNLQSNYRLEPNSEFEVWLYSEPVLLGTVESDDNGQVDDEVTIPEDSAEKGYHTLRVEGQNIAGEKTAIYKSIFVSNTDYSDRPVHEHECENDDGFLVACEPTEETEPIPLPEPDEPTDNIDAQPKPPINNPETEAGNEQANEQHPEDEETDRQTESTDTENTPEDQTTTTADTTDQAPTTINQNTSSPTNIATESQNTEDTDPADNPQVAGVVSEDTNIEEPVSPAQSLADTQTQLSIASVLYGAGILGLLAVLLVIQRKRRANQ